MRPLSPITARVDAPDSESAPGAVRRAAIAGLGLMGSALGACLIEDDWEVRGCDIDPAKRRAFAELGGQALETPAEAARGASLVITCLLRAETVCEVLLGPRGAVGASTPRTVFIDTSTVLPEETEDLARRMATAGAAFLELPVAGSSAEVRARRALALAGGDAKVLARALPALSRLFRAVHHLGPHGSAARAKLAVNLVLGLNRAALAEGLAFARALGLDPGAALALLRDSPASSRVMETKGPKMIAGEYSPQAKLAQHAKDVDLILQAAERLRVSLPLSALHRQLLLAGEAQGLGDADNSAIFEVIRRMSVRGTLANQSPVLKKLGRLAQESGKLSPGDETRLAEEGMASEASDWPDY